MTIDGEELFEYKKNRNYLLTKSGKVYSTYKRGGKGSTDKLHPRKLALGQDKDGYYRCVLCDNGMKTYIKVHTMIVEQFIGDIADGLVVNHKDGNKKNNSVDNLEIVTVAENTIHAHKNGFTSREIPVNVQYDGETYNFASLTECMNFFPDISQHYIRQIMNGDIEYSMVLFDKDKISGDVIATYNGKEYMRFKTMTDADRYFGKSKGVTFSAMKYNEYRKRVNKYNITFPNVSTIEN